MASLWITEYKGNATVPTGGIAPQEEANTVQKITLGSATQSAPFAQTTKLVRLACDGACHVLFGTVGDNPVATTDDTYLPLGHVGYFAVSPGHRLSVITA